MSLDRDNGAATVAVLPMLSSIKSGTSHGVSVFKHPLNHDLFFNLLSCIELVATCPTKRYAKCSSTRCATAHSDGKHFGFILKHE